MYGLFTFMSLTVLTPMPGDALRCYHGLSAGTKTECDEGVTFCMIGIFKDSLFFSLVTQQMAITESPNRE